MSKHTKGPWVVVGKHFEPEVMLDDEYEILINEADEQTYRIIGSVTVNLGIDEPEAVANAHLIAAAPDLLEACKAVVKYQKLIESGATSGLISAYAEAFESVSAAIAKATGGAA